MRASSGKPLTALISTANNKTCVSLEVSIFYLCYKLSGLLCLFRFQINSPTGYKENVVEPVCSSKTKALTATTISVAIDVGAPAGAHAARKLKIEKPILRRCCIGLQCWW